MEALGREAPKPFLALPVGAEGRGAVPDPFSTSPQPLLFIPEEGWVERAPDTESGGPGPSPASARTSGKHRSPHFMKGEFSYETFPKPKWHKAKKNYFYRRNFEHSQAPKSPLLGFFDILGLIWLTGAQNKSG